MFTYAEETADGGGHYEDFLKTLEFLAASDEPVDTLRTDLGALRQAALCGEPTAAIRDRVQTQLRRWIARTERPTDARQTTTLAKTTERFGVRADDFLGFVALRRVADAVDAPLSVEYWKSAPYFLNFLAGYRVGEHVRDAMKAPDRRASLMPLFRGAQPDRKTQRSAIPAGRVGQCTIASVGRGNPRCADWWRLLWMPPSLPYHRLGGPYESIDSTAITKQLIFSSWVAAPSAIASLLSYEVQRRIFTKARRFENSPAARAAISNRLDYRLANERPASMSALALFWPQPALASRTDPLDAAREHAESPSVERLIEWAEGRAKAVVGPAGRTGSTASAVWHWFAPVYAERVSSLASALLGARRSTLTEALAGASPEHPVEDVPRALDAHVEQALTALDGPAPEPERPADLLATSALLGLGAPGNIAWRALNRPEATGRPGDRVGAVARSGDSRVGAAECVRPARGDTPARRPIREVRQHARGRWRLLAPGRSLLHRRRPASRPR